MSAAGLSRIFAARLFTAVALVVPLGSVLAQQSMPGPIKGIVKELRSGPLLMHGNYCGIGAKPGHPEPIDALDAACMRHDGCTKTGSLPSCACDDRLRVEAAAIAKDPRTPADIQATAAATAAAMAVLICKIQPAVPRSANPAGAPGSTTPPAASPSAAVPPAAVPPADAASPADTARPADTVRPAEPPTDVPPPGDPTR